jgi:hypothetical protein
MIRNTGIQGICIVTLKQEGIRIRNRIVRIRGSHDNVAMRITLDGEPETSVFYLLPRNSQLHPHSLSNSFSLHLPIQWP